MIHYRLYRSDLLGYLEELPEIAEMINSNTTCTASEFLKAIKKGLKRERRERKKEREEFRIEQEERERIAHENFCKLPIKQMIENLIRIKNSPMQILLKGIMTHDNCFDGDPNPFQWKDREPYNPQHHNIQHPVHYKYVEATNTKEEQ